MTIRTLLATVLDPFGTLKGAKSQIKSNHGPWKSLVESPSPTLANIQLPHQLPDYIPPLLQVTAPLHVRKQQDTQIPKKTETKERVERLVLGIMLSNAAPALLLVPL